MVVIPTLFTDEPTVIELVRHLEVHYLANQDDNLYFGLLGDFGEARERRDGRGCCDHGCSARGH
ncbi:MAG: hypothetical protein WKF84_00890 [Pyrinomonadaceae bacterium]